VSNALGLPVAGLTSGVGNGFVGPIAQASDAGAVNPDCPVEDAGYEVPQQAFVGPRAVIAQPADPAAKTDTAAAPLIVDDPSVKVASDDKAFTASDAELAQVDGSFTETKGEPIDQRLQANDQKNDFKVDLTYSSNVAKDEKTPAAAKAEDKGPVFNDDKMSAGEFIRNLLGLKQDGDKKAYDILDKLEHSHNDKDKHVLNQFKHRDKHDGGKGSRRWGDDFGGG
jgi:hypothetical protein